MRRDEERVSDEVGERFIDFVHRDSFTLSQTQLRKPQEWGRKGHDQIITLVSVNYQFFCSHPQILEEVR